MDRIEKVLDSSRTHRNQLAFGTNITKKRIKPVLPHSNNLQPAKNQYDLYYSVKQQ